ncbi:MAG: ABC transporter substrate-binding protein [Solirubrobacteraceae bacterium]|nr:ABC transporter substrate-binding protein [Solirubrobacteraceae bacterium]
MALATFMLLAGCGGDDEPETATGTQTTPPVSWTLVLDYEPNAVHAGLIRAEEAGYFDDAGIDLDIVAPSSTSDALTQVTRGRADVGLADLIDVARRNERAATPKGQAQPEADGQVTLAAAIVQRPLSGLIVRADAGITKPEQLAGKKIAVSGLPSDEAVVAAIARKDDEPVDTKLITLGFNGLKALDARRVDATTAYWPADEVTLEQLGTAGRTFALDKFGGPAYPGLVAFVNRRLAADDPVHVGGFAKALTRGTLDVIADPAVGEAAVQQRFPELDASITKAQLRRYVPLFGSPTTAGAFNQDDLEAFTEFAAESGLTDRKLTVPELSAIPPESAQP